MTAEIFDRGYRRYDGPRTGVRGAVRSLVVNSMQRSLGIHRPARYKIAPVFVIALAFIPALVYVGISVLIPSDVAQEFVPSFSGYFAQTTTSLFLMASFTGAELLCTDRRTGMLGVYLSSPLTRPMYLVAKAASSVSMMLLVALVPNLTYLLALSLQGNGPDGLVTTFKVMLQIAVAALMIAIYYSAVSLAVASTTERSAIAITATLGLLVGSAAISSTLVDGLGASTTWRILNLFLLPIELAPRVFGEWEGWSPKANPTWTLLLAWFVIVAGSAAIIWARYRRLAVQR